MRHAQSGSRSALVPCCEPGQVMPERLLGYSDKRAPQESIRAVRLIPAARNADPVQISFLPQLMQINSVVRQQ